MNHSAFSLPLQVCCRGTQPKGALAKRVIGRLRRRREIRRFPPNPSSLRLHSISPPLIVNFENGDCGVSQLAARIANPRGLQEEPDVARRHCIPRQPDNAGEQRYHHLGVLAGVRDPKFVDGRYDDKTRTQDGRRKFAHHQAADLAGRMNPLTVGKAVQAGIVAILGQGVIGRETSRRKGRKVLADAFGVPLRLALDRPRRPLRALIGSRRMINRG